MEEFEEGEYFCGASIFIVFVWIIYCFGDLDCVLFGEIIVQKKENSVYCCYLTVSNNHRNAMLPSSTMHYLSRQQTSSMVDGQVGYHRPDNVRRIKIEKNNPIVNALNKTKQELYPDLAKEQQTRMREIQLETKEKRKAENKQKKLEELENARIKEEMSYDRIMGEHNMTSNAGE